MQQQPPIKIKICGVSRREDASYIADLGVEALGFVFYPLSPRYIAPERAAEIISVLPAHIRKVGVFVDETESRIREIAKISQIDTLQLHGREDVDFCKRLSEDGYSIVKVFRVADTKKVIPEHITKYNMVWAIMFDTYHVHQAGGTGRSFNWEVLKELNYPPAEVFLSGGLDAKNVNQACSIFRPQWVDVSTSVEDAPGIKNYEKVKEFVEAVRKL